MPFVFIHGCGCLFHRPDCHHMGWFSYAFGRRGLFQRSKSREQEERALDDDLLALHCGYLSSIQLHYRELGNKLGHLVCSGNSFCHTDTGDEVGSQKGIAWKKKMMI